MRVRVSDGTVLIAQRTQCVHFVKFKPPVCIEITMVILCVSVCYCYRRCHTAAAATATATIATFYYRFFFIEFIRFIIFFFLLALAPLRSQVLKWLARKNVKCRALY